MPNFVKVARRDEVPPGRGKTVNAEGVAVALFNVNGTFFAISNTCVHRGGPLGKGVLDGRLVICPWHAWAYDVTTGQSDANPDLRVARYEAKVEDGQVLVKV